MNKDIPVFLCSLYPKSLHLQACQATQSRTRSLIRMETKAYNPNDSEQSQAEYATMFYY